MSNVRHGKKRLSNRKLQRLKKPKRRLRRTNNSEETGKAGAKNVEKNGCNRKQRNRPYEKSEKRKEKNLRNV